MLSCSDGVPSPYLSSSHNDGVYVLLHAYGEQLLVDDDLRPENMQDSSNVTGVESLLFTGVTSSHLLRLIFLQECGQSTALLKTLLGFGAVL